MPSPIDSFLALLEALPDAIVIVNQSGRIELVNAQAEALFGYVRQDMVGQSIELLVPEQARAGHVAQRSRYQANARTRPMGAGLDLAGRRSDGSEFPVEISLSPIQTPDGGFTIAAIRDMTERRQAEEERSRLLRERAAHAEANRIKDEFLATLSHELRTPLNAILGWTTVLRERSLDAPASRKALATIERNARLQAQLIEDLLDVSRIVTGKLRLQMQPMDLATVVDHAVEVIRPPAEAKRLSLDVVIETRPLLMPGDPDRLQQAVWNLLSNAVKFSNEGGRVELKLWVGGRSAHLTIRDTGRGIPREFLPYVFDRFRQADSSYTRAVGGLGLGLSIVRSIVELHGGAVSAQSAGPGQGSVFTVDLPLTRATSEAGHETTFGLSDEALSRELNGIRVVVVDDQEDERELLAEIFSQHGAEVRAAGSADEALAMIASTPPHVLVTDLAMPAADGYVLLRRLRALPPPLGNIPAVAVTAHARAEDRDQALAAGFQVYVAKPVEPRRLLSAVAHVARRFRRDSSG